MILESFLLPSEYELLEWEVNFVGISVLAKLYIVVIVLKKLIRKHACLYLIIKKALTVIERKIDGQ